MRDRGPDYEVLGQTLDDAAGEAFDKGARLLGLGFPGGPGAAAAGSGGRSRRRSRFPTGARVRGLDFSFAGLKTALLYAVRDLGPEETERRRADLAAAYQRAIVEALAVRAERALEQTGLTRLAIGGGVAANGPLRERLGDARGDARGPADRALHRQRGDDRLGGALRGADPVPGLPRARRVRDRRAGARRGGAVVSGARPRSCSTGGPAATSATRRALVIRRVGATHPFALRERNIEESDELLRAYLERIPVICIDGVETFELFVDERRFAAGGRRRAARHAPRSALRATRVTSRS